MKIAVYTYRSTESMRIRQAILDGIQGTPLEYDEDHPDIVITIGGDGTLLSAFHRYQHLLDQVRFVGIHTGHLGFYTDWRNYEVQELLKSLQNDSGQSVAYPLLDMEATMSDGRVKHIVALNESTLRNIVKTMVCDVYVNDQLFERFRGDGLCISTPTGSTAYNKSAGGAIMDPNIIGFQLAEMASLNNRVFRTLGSPVIFGTDAKLTFRLRDDSSAVLTCDREQMMLGQDDWHLQEITYRVAKEKIHFAKYRHNNFFMRVKNSFIGETY
ncbi:NAD kinase [Limosilactobacillus fermentum]|uniref:NAD kinase n=1 Tax=Limosilactobacillus fermentum TaxID=1613 RepID=UPI003B66F60F